MNILNILAVTDVAETTQTMFAPVKFLWEQIDSLTWLQAVIAVSFGAVYILYGWRIFKVLVVISFALFGLFVGITLGGKIGTEVWGGVIGLLILAAISVPLMRFAVSILGAIAGGFITGSLWYACGLSEKYILAGVLLGIIAGGMISFIVFRISVMLFTSLAGSGLIVVGLLALLHLYPYNSGEDYVRELVFNHKWFLPIAFLIPTLIGLLTQNKLIKHSPQWEL